MLQVHKSNPSFLIVELQVIFNSVNGIHCTNPRHLRIAFASVKGFKQSLSWMVYMYRLKTYRASARLFFLLRVFSLHNIWKSHNCSWIESLCFIPEELSCKNLNFWWQSCAGKHQVKHSGMLKALPWKIPDPNLLAFFPPLKYSFPMQTRFLFNGNVVLILMQHLANTCN